MKTKKNKAQVGGEDGTSGVLLGRPTVEAASENSKLHAGLVEAGLVSERPTVAANAGTDLNRKLLQAFEAADVSNAEYLRLPAPRARCRLSSLSRTTLCELVERGEIRAIKVRRPGAQRGVVLINRRSLLDYLHRLEAEQCGEVNGKGGA